MRWLWIPAVSAVVAVGVWYFVLRPPQLSGRIHYRGRDYLLDDSPCYTKAQLLRSDAKYKQTLRPWGTYGGRQVMIDDYKTDLGRPLAYTPATLNIKKRAGCWLVYDLSGGP